MNFFLLLLLLGFVLSGKEHIWNNQAHGLTTDDDPCSTNPWQESDRNPIGCWDMTRDTQCGKMILTPEEFDKLLYHGIWARSVVLVESRAHQRYRDMCDPLKKV